MIRFALRVATALACLAATTGTAGVLAPEVRPVLWAQQVDPGEEGRLLRTAAAHEARGDAPGAEGVLRGLLDRFPVSSGGLFALERVLRSQGRVAEVLPFADRYLESQPGGSGVRYLKLRVLVEVDSLATLEDEAERWIRAEPGSPEPFREAARVFETAYGAPRALQLLRRGEAELDEPRSLAVDMGDILMRLDRPAEAVVAWSRAIGDAGQDVQAVLRRLSQLPGDRAEVVRPLVLALDTEPTTVERRRAGVQVALEVGLEAEALELARRALGALTLAARRGFLTDLARQAEERSASRVALWAYETLRSRATDEAERRALDLRIASAALAAADTATAVEARRRLVDALPAGSPERRRVAADLIRVEAAGGASVALVRTLERFRSEFPDATEIDELASAVAEGLKARGHATEAAAVLEGIQGPRSALARAFLLFENGDVDQGKAALAGSLAGLAPREATGVIQLLSLLERLDPGSSTLLAGAAALAHRGDVPGALARLEGGLPEVPEADRAALLAHAARLADEGRLPARAAALRQRLLEEHPDAPEGGDATLALARYRAAEPAGAKEAVRLLEELILARPNAPVVPAARRELQRLKARVSGGGP